MATKQELRHYAKENGVSLAEAREHFINLAIKQEANKMADVDNFSHIDKEFFKQMKARGGYDPVVSEYVETSYAVQNKCYDNAERYARENGGEVIYGWGNMPYNHTDSAYVDNGVVELHQHAIVKQGDKYIDVTPYSLHSETGSPINDVEFQRYFWRDDMMDPKVVQLDNTIWINPTYKGYSYKEKCYDLAHVQPGKLCLLNPDYYNRAFFNKKKNPYKTYEEAKKYYTFSNLEKMGFKVYDLSA